LINYTKEPLSVIYTAARTCTSSAHPDEIQAKKASLDKKRSLIEKVVDSGHHSVLEHTSFTFAISGISRACSHQLVRHRIASYSQQSQRYVKSSDDMVIPPSIRENELLCSEFKSLTEEIQNLYVRFTKEGIPKEDARYILPNAVTTNIVMSMNLRELMHTSALRLCTKAQWEIRELFTKIKERVGQVDSFLANFLNPKCISLGYCPEEGSCGRTPKKV